MQKNENHSYIESLTDVLDRMDKDPDYLRPISDVKLSEITFYLAMHGQTTKDQELKTLLWKYLMKIKEEKAIRLLCMSKTQPQKCEEMKQQINSKEEAFHLEQEKQKGEATSLSSQFSAIFKRATSLFSGRPKEIVRQQPSSNYSLLQQYCQEEPLLGMIDEGSTSKGEQIDLKLKSQ